MISQIVSRIVYGLFFVAGFLAVAALTSCAAVSQHPLTSVARDMPIPFTCGAPDEERAVELITRFESDPDLVREELLERFRADPVSLTCTLLDVRHVLLSTGRRLTEAYRETSEALRALGLD